MLMTVFINEYVYVFTPELSESFQPLLISLLIFYCGQFSWHLSTHSAFSYKFFSPSVFMNAFPYSAPSM